MKEIDRIVAEKYNFTEDEFETYITRMGLMVEDSREDERSAAKICINEILQKRRKVV